MKRTKMALAALATIISFARLDAAEPQLAHMVFFTLAEDTKKNREKLVAACQKHLGEHEGTVYFSAGTLAEDLNREVNDQDFDVSLHLVFANMKVHDTYQTHPRHLKFIEENKSLWSKVRVFDSYLAVPKHDTYPTAARGFAGMIKGKVIETNKGEIIVEIAEVTWGRSKAEDPKALLRKKLLVKSKADEGPIARFLGKVKVGETVTLDVANKSGDTLSILELSEEQRERVEE